MPVVSRVDAIASKLIRISKGSHKNHRDLRASFRGSNKQQQQAICEQAETLNLSELLDEVLIEPDEIE